MYIHELSAEQRLLLGRPDVSVLQSDATGGTSAAVASREAPVYGHVYPATDIVREPFIEIRDTDSRQVVTVIELLSPTNKSIGADRDQYIAKRRRIMVSGVHIVEVDLLRGGPRMPVENMPQCDYIVMVSRSEEHPRVGLWPVRLKERLPEVPIPLLHGDPDALIDLQPLLNKLYDAAGYADYIYRGRPSPPLHPEDAKWAEGIIAAQSLAT